MGLSNEKSQLNDSKRQLIENVKNNIAKIETKSSKYYNFHNNNMKRLLETQVNRSNKPHSFTLFSYNLMKNVQA